MNVEGVVLKAVITVESTSTHLASMIRFDCHELRNFLKTEVPKLHGLEIEVEYRDSLIKLMIPWFSRIWLVYTPPEFATFLERAVPRFKDNRVVVSAPPYSKKAGTIEVIWYDPKYHESLVPVERKRSYSI